MAENGESKTPATPQRRRGLARPGRGMAPLLRPGMWRANIFMAVNLAVFAAAGAFWHYLSTGRWFTNPFQTLREDLGTPLGQMLLAPINIFTHPWMVLVAGLLLAAVIFVPILVAVLYRLVFAVLFVAAVAALAHAPALAIALGVGCVLAARTPLRSDMPFLAVLLGLAPVAAYLYLFGLSVVYSSAVQPLQRGVAGAPFLIAMIGAVLAGAIVLSLARVTRYRPGVIWPILGLLLGGPVALFHTRVGADELEYLLIAAELAPGDAVFKTIPLADWKQANATQGLSDELLVNAVDEDVKKRGIELIKVCENFIERRPGSRRAATVLWVAAQCHSLRTNRIALHGGLVKYYASHASPASQSTWLRLIEQFSASPQAGPANLRLAQLALRELAEKHISDERITDLLAKTDRHLRDAEDRLRTVVAALYSPGRTDVIDRVFLPPAPLPAGGYYHRALFATRRLRWLIDANEVIAAWSRAVESNDEQTKAAAGKLVLALGSFVTLDPDGRDYAGRLGTLAGQFENTNLGDNLKLAFANTSKDPYERAFALIPLAKVRPPTDAAIQASYELGILATGTADATAVPLIKDLLKPEEYFKLVIAAPDNPWKPLAQERLNWLRAGE